MSESNTKNTRTSLVNSATGPTLAMEASVDMETVRQRDPIPTTMEEGVRTGMVEVAGKQAF